MARKKTHEEFMKDFEEKQPELFARVEVLEKYKGRHSSILCECVFDHTQWSPTPGNLFQGHGCPTCGGVKPYTINSFKEQLVELNPNLIVLTNTWENTKTKMKFKCVECEYIWETTPHSILRKGTCPNCYGNVPYTTDSFKEKLKEINPDIEIIGEYTNVNTKIKCKCLIDGYKWETAPRNLLNGCGCHTCAMDNRKDKLKLSQNEFVVRVNNISPNIEVLGNYINNNTPVLCRCKIDNYRWNPRPSNLLNGSKCPKCSHTGTSWLQEQIENYFSTKYTILSRDTSIIGMELDIVIPELKLAIEPGSWYWHYEVADKRDRDAEKRRLCAEKGYTCITIYDACDEPELVPFRNENSCLIYEDDIGTHKYLLDDVLDSIEDIIKTK